MKHRTGIRHKVVMIICLSTLSVISIAVAIAYFLGYNLSHDMMGDVHRKLSQQLAGNIGNIIDKEMGRVIAYANDPLFKGAALKADAKYKDTPLEEGGSPLSAGYTQEDVNARLRALERSDGNLVRASLLYGSASLEMPLKIDAPVPGKELFTRDMEFDEAAKAWVVPVLVPIRGDDSSIIGVFRASLSAEKLFSSLGSFRIDKTGRAVLANGRGRIMFRPGISQLNVPVCDERDYRRLLTSKGRYCTIKGGARHKSGSVFIAFSDVISRLLSDNNIAWRVFVEQDEKEMFAPLSRFMFGAVLAVIFLLIIMVPIGFAFSGVISKPIQELNKAVGQIAGGNWDYKIKIKTGDEIEEFSEAFGAMVTDIKDKQAKLVSARNVERPRGEGE